MSMVDMSPAKRNRLLLWAAIVLLVGGVIWAARKVLLPYILGLVLAYLLLPLVNWLDRHMPARFRTWRIARPLSIAIVYLLLFLVIAGIVAFVIPLVVDQVKVLIENWPTLAGRVQGWGTRGWGWYTENIPADWRETIETNLRGLGDDLLKALRDGLLVTVRTVSSTMSVFLGLVVIPFWLFYILQDEQQVKEGVLTALPRQVRADVRCMARLIDDILSAYIRGQLLLCLFVGGMATIAMTIIGVPFALVLGLVAGIFEVLPYVGPILGAIPAVLVALLTDPISALWVMLSFVAIQQVENLILVPRISGKSVALHPALVMVALVVGNEIAGLIGMLIAVPVTAVIRDVFKYLYLRLLDEPLAPEEALTRIRSGGEVQLDV
jgi:predicted PurR-regulated permease PerM